MGAAVFFQQLAVSFFVGAAICAANDAVGALDWGDWHEQPRDSNSSSGVDFDVEISTRNQGKLHALVNECAQRLDVHGVACPKKTHEPQWVPFMDSGDLDCGFQTQMTPGTFEGLAAKYSFHFVGDSTTRRLTESFIAIKTGVASGHEFYHDARDLSVGGLKVVFHWAPYCSGGNSSYVPVGAGIDEALDHENRLSDGRQTVFVTAFGIWDASQGTCDEAALSACSEVVTKLTKLGQTSITSETAVNKDARPPTVLLLQNNPFSHGPRQDFLNDLHQAQREIVGSGEDGDVYLVNDTESVYHSMWCFMIGDGPHFHDPIKLVEAKMLWDLISLVDGALA